METLVMPVCVTEAFARYPEPIRMRLLTIRGMVFAIAADTNGVGPLTETLKWGEPAYLTEQSRSGTSIRLGVSRLAPDCCAVFFNCQTRLVSTFRTHFDGVFGFEGNRAILLSTDTPLMEEPLAFCLHAAMTYHRQKNRPAIAPNRRHDLEDF
jgi:hypothetical protein